MPYPYEDNRYREPHQQPYIPLKRPRPYGEVQLGGDDGPLNHGAAPGASTHPPPAPGPDAGAEHRNDAAVRSTSDQDAERTARRERRIEMAAQRQWSDYVSEGTAWSPSPGYLGVEDTGVAAYTPERTGSAPAAPQPQGRQPGAPARRTSRASAEDRIGQTLKEMADLVFPRDGRPHTPEQTEANRVRRQELKQQLEQQRLQAQHWQLTPHHSNGRSGP